MNKRGIAPYIAIVILVTIILILGGYISFDTFTKKYDLQNVEADNKNLDAGDSTRIFFDVFNKESLTFLGKVELIANETCFYSTQEQPLSEVQPKSRIRSSVTLRVNSLYGSKEEACRGKPFPITIKLKDASGKVLDEETIIIGIEER